MTKDSCCLWTAERTDDSLKSMFQADEAYAHGNKSKALSYLEAQINYRIPAITKRAVKECGKGIIVPKDLSKDLDRVGLKMIADRSVKEVHAFVMEVDHKYAAPAYRAFAKCSR